MFLNFVLAWFIQMGIHEGSHAWAAYWCGDDTAYLMGKRTFDPFRHIEWTNLNSVLLGVVMPIFTAFNGNIPMGMAWVPINPLRFKKMRRDHALVAAAGPISNFILAAVLLLAHIALGQMTFIKPATFKGINDLLQAVYLTSIVYGVFNAIPMPPLDGSRVLYYFLPMNLRQVMDDIEPYGFYLLIALFWFGRGGAIIEPVLVGFMLLWSVF